jgi:hypothetical protein
MDLDRMLDKCRKGQWKIDDLDWGARPRPMRRHEEMAIVQYFTDMAAIELLAGALFEVQRNLVDDATLKKIFATFIADEERHSEVAQRLADHYNVHHYRNYTVSPELSSFRPHFLNALQYLSPEIANVYITSGELMLDVALLRSLNDFVDDEMSNAAMDLINLDESRHIAMDYFMMEYYVQPHYLEQQANRRSSPLQQAEAAWAFMNVLYYAKPFMKAVFLNPMKVTDPEGKRIKEAFKRMQLLSAKPHLMERPFSRFLKGLRDAYQTPVFGKVFGGVISRVGGAPGRFMIDLYTEEEFKRASRMSMDELAEEAIGAKHMH